jgi:hypothetical protein
MSDDAEERGYEVGYGKPPHQSRFRPGESGNPRGRPRSAKNTSTVIREALNERVKLKDSRRSMSKLEISMAQLANKAAGGDLKAIGMVLGLYRDIEAAAAAAGESAQAPLDSADREILEMLLHKVRAATEAGGGE